MTYRMAQLFEMAAVELHKLNGDTSWLFRLPCLSSVDATATFYNVILDPWLHPTPQTDGSPLFSRQTRTEPAAFASIGALDEWLRDRSQGEERVDAILFSHSFTDHIHPQTLADHASLAVLRRVTVFTTTDSSAALRWLKVAVDHEKVVNLCSVDFGHDTDQNRVLPQGISVQHLPAKDWALSPAWSKLHGAILIRCQNTARPVQIVYSPHGITPTSLTASVRQNDEDAKRILIHSFDRQTLPLIGVVSCGLPNILQLIPAFKPHLILATHDEHKQAEGLVGHLLRREHFSLDQATQLVSRLRAPTVKRLHCVLKQLAPGESICIV